jgi:hypothetical protein
MDSNDISDYKGFSPENPRKKVHSISNNLFVVLDEAIAKRLGINDSDTWLEQIATENGEILLRKWSIKEVEIK